MPLIPNQDFTFLIHKLNSKTSFIHTHLPLSLFSKTNMTIKLSENIPSKKINYMRNDGFYLSLLFANYGKKVVKYFEPIFPFELINQEQLNKNNTLIVSTDGCIDHNQSIQYLMLLQDRSSMQVCLIQLPNLCNLENYLKCF